MYCFILINLNLYVTFIRIIMQTLLAPHSILLTSLIKCIRLNVKNKLWFVVLSRTTALEYANKTTYCLVHTTWSHEISYTCCGTIYFYCFSTCTHSILYWMNLYELLLLTYIHLYYMLMCYVLTGKPWCIIKLFVLIFFLLL